MKPRLLVAELWGLGDLAIGAPFLRAACQSYQVALIAKPAAQELAGYLNPDIQVIPFVAPWTAFRGKYRLHRWPWRALIQAVRSCRRFAPDIAISARWDPRDHVLLRLSGARRRLGYPRTKSQHLLTDPLPLVGSDAPRSAQWTRIGETLGLPIPPVPGTQQLRSRDILIHTGAAQALRVWPLARYAQLVRTLRASGWTVRILCDPNQLEAWKALDETPMAPGSVGELLNELNQTSLFLGNDSGPGHLAAALEIPTFTLFGPQRPEWFLPNHPQAGWIPGLDCPHKPCFDSCRFERAHCLADLPFDAVQAKVETWLKQWPR